MEGIVAHTDGPAEVAVSCRLFVQVGDGPVLEVGMFEVPLSVVVLATAREEG